MSFQPAQLDTETATINLQILLVALLIINLIVFSMQSRDTVDAVWRIWVNRLPQRLLEVLVVCLAMFVVTHFN